MSRLLSLLWETERVHSGQWSKFTQLLQLRDWVQFLFAFLGRVSLRRQRSKSVNLCPNTERGCCMPDNELLSLASWYLPIAPLRTGCDQGHIYCRETKHFHPDHWPKFTLLFSAESQSEDKARQLFFLYLKNMYFFFFLLFFSFLRPPKKKFKPT